MPGGVNSPVRAFKSVGGQPIVMDSVKGSHMWDIDGNEYIDYVGSWGPAIIGHADDEVPFLLLSLIAKICIRKTSVLGLSGYWTLKKSDSPILGCFFLCYTFWIH